jgi:hypothetical protein
MRKVSTLRFVAVAASCLALSGIAWAGESCGKSHGAAKDTTATQCLKNDKGSAKTSSCDHAQTSGTAEKGGCGGKHK